MAVGSECARYVQYGKRGVALLKPCGVCAAEAIACFIALGIFKRWLLSTQLPVMLHAEDYCAFMSVCFSAGKLSEECRRSRLCKKQI